MGYVPGYRHDIFVSYATADNRPASQGIEETRWVKALVENLFNQLPAELKGSKDAIPYFDETRIHENDPIGPQLDEAVRGSALLLVVASPSWLASDWCRRERELFLGPTRAPVREGRVFVVTIYDMPLGDWQEHFLPDLRAFDFLTPPAATAARELLGYPSVRDGEGLDRRYFAALKNLVVKVAAKLKAMKTEATPPADPTRPRVYVAEGTPDLEDVRQPLRSFLMQSGFDMVPRSPYARNPREYEAAVVRDLRDALAFVQLNGPYVTPRTPDLPAGYEGLQIECARAAGLPILRWIPKTLGLQGLRDSKDLGTQANETVQDTDVEAFKLSLLDTLRRLHARRDIPVPEPALQPFVGLVAPNDDREADEVSARLVTERLGVDIIPEQHSLTDLSDDDVAAYDGLLVLFNVASEDWVRARARQLRQLQLRLSGRQKTPPVFGFYRFQPPKRLLTRIPEFHVIDGGPAGDLRPFIDRVVARRASARV